MIYFSYRDADGNRGELRRIAGSLEQLILKEGIMRGAFGYPDLHVTHVRCRAGDQEALVVCTTETVLSDAMRQQITNGVAELLSKAN